MEGILSVFAYIQSLGSVVFVPLIIMLVGLVFKLDFKKSLRAGVTVGAGFIGVNLILGIVWTNIGPISTAIVEKFGLTMNVIDVGWGAASAVAFSTQVGALIIPFILLVNVVMLVFKLTKTVNVDIWNYWHYAFTGSVVVVMTGSITYGLLAAAAHAIIALKFGDISAKRVEEEIGLPGVSIPHGSSAVMVPIAYAMDKIYDKIPFFKHKEEEEEIEVKPIFEFLTEPLIMGLIIGLLLGFLGADYSGGFLGALPTALNLGVNMAALMLLMPRVVKVIMEGLIPISAAAKVFMEKRFKGREFYIGLDAAVVLGHPTTLVVAAILIPVTLFLALVLPGNTTLPFADLAALSFFVALVTPIHRSNMRRTLVTGTLIMVITLYCSSAMAPYLTQVAVSTTPDVLANAGAATITAMVAGGNFVTLLLSKAVSSGLVGIVAVVAVTAAIVFITIKKEDKFN